MGGWGGVGVGGQDMERTCAQTMKVTLRGFISIKHWF